MSNTNRAPTTARGPNPNHDNSGSDKTFFFRLSEFFFYPPLARLDIGAGVEQPFGCLIVQNRQAV